jgi:RNA polymerase sigma-70 factor (ECF subfamily)
MPVDELSDADLVVLARSGDADAFCVLAGRYRAMALSVALHLAGQRETAEDLVQEATLAAFVSLGRLRDPGCFRSWFYGTVLNVTRAWRRRQAGGPVSLEEWDTVRLIADPVDLAAQRELRWIVTDALRCLPEADRTVLVLFYYDGLSLREIAARLGVTAAAVKSRLHKGRSRLGRLLAAEYPELTRAPARGERTHAMTELRITSVVPFPTRVLAVLADEPGQRVLPAWLTPMEGLSLVGPAEAGPAPPGSTRLPSPELAAKVLAAAGGAVQSMRIGELDHGLLFGTLTISGPAGENEVQAGLGDALGLARQQHCPILADDDVLARHGVAVPPGEPVEDLLIRQAGLPLQARDNGASRTADPQNLQFGDGLEHWALRGIFLKDISGGHWQDYACGTEQGSPDGAAASGYLKAQVPDPPGFADLRQGILADAYRGRRVRLSADVRTAGVSKRAGLYLRVIDPARSRPPEVREQFSLQGTSDWTRHHVEADVPADSVYLLFGISLTGPGQIWAASVRVEPA